MYRVYINDVLLNDTPEGLDDYLTKFKRDNQISGIYSTNVLDLTFVGDGYCLLKEITETGSSCSNSFRIEEKCRNSSYINIFNGSILPGKIKLELSAQKAVAEIEDVSPLSLINQYSEMIFDFESTEDVFGNTLQSPVSFGSLDFFDEQTSYTYNDRPVVPISELFKSIVSYMTGYEVEFQSDFFSDISLGTAVNKWNVNWTVIPGAGQQTTVTIKAFNGTIHTRTVTSSGATHVADVLKLFVSDYTPIPSTDPDIRQFFRKWKQDFFWFSDQTSATEGDVYSILPVEIVSIETVGSGVVEYSQISEFTDGARGLRFLNYNMLKDQTSPYNFKMTFRDLMQSMNQQFNAGFLAYYESGKVIFRLENVDFFEQFDQTLILDNVKELTAEFEGEAIFGGMDISDGSGNDSYTNGTTSYTSNFCGVSEVFDAKNKLVYDTNAFWIDLAETYSENKDKIYMVQQQIGSDDAVAATVSIQNSAILNTYNPYLGNDIAAFRHFNKFKGDLTSSPDFKFINTSPIRRFKKYQFTANITEDQYNTFIDSLVDNIRFKTSEMTAYYTGIIMEADYNRATGNTIFTVLGE